MEKKIFIFPKGTDFSTIINYECLKLGNCESITVYFDGEVDRHTQLKNMGVQLNPYHPTSTVFIDGYDFKDTKTIEQYLSPDLKPREYLAAGRGCVDIIKDDIQDGEPVVKRGSLKVESVNIFMTLPDEYNIIERDKFKEILNYLRECKQYQDGKTNSNYGIFQNLYDSLLCNLDFEIVDIRTFDPPMVQDVHKYVTILEQNDYTILNYPDILPTVLGAPTFYDEKTKKIYHRINQKVQISKVWETKEIEKFVVDHLRTHKSKLYNAVLSQDKEFVVIQSFIVDKGELF
jgi:hypothetical protein